MLSLWKLRVGAEAYYLGQVARGLDDYYTGVAETEGRWIGTGADLLGLADEVTGDDLRPVCAPVEQHVALGEGDVLGEDLQSDEGRLG